MIIKVKIIPASSKNDVEKQEDGSYRVYVTSPAVEGKANTHLIKLLSKFFKVPKSRFEITKGLKSRLKTITIVESF